MPLSPEHSLSEEVIDAITSLCTRHSLTKLCLTSKKLNRIANPYLYAVVDFDSLAYMQVIPLMHLVLTSRAHASLIRSVSIDSAWPEHGIASWRDEERSGERKWPSDRELEDVLRNSCAVFAADEKDACDLYKNLETDATGEVMVVLFLTNLPKLSKLDLNFLSGIDAKYPFFIAALERLGDRGKPFDRIPAALNDVLSQTTFELQSQVGFSVPIDVMVKGDDDKYPNNPDNLAVLFHLPYLRSFYGWMMGDEDDQELAMGPFANLKPRTCPVAYVELRCSKLHKKKLQLLLNSTIPGKLKTFVYEIGCVWAWCSIEHPAIMRDLEVHQSTLKVLTLSHEWMYPYQSDDGADDGAGPVSFTSFTAMTQLKVAPVWIWGDKRLRFSRDFRCPETVDMLWQALPESLQELWITRAEDPLSHPEDTSAACFVPDCLLPSLQKLFSEKPKQFPSLERFCIEFPPQEWKVEWFDDLAALCVEAMENGVHCTVMLNGLRREWSDYVERNWGWDEDIVWGPCFGNQEVLRRRIIPAEENDLAYLIRSLVS